MGSPGRGNHLVLLLTLAATAWLGSHAVRVGVEYDNESLRSSDAVDSLGYENFKATFGSDEDILVAVSHPQLLEAQGLTLLDELTREIASLDGVERVWSLVGAQELVRGETGVEPRALLAPPWDAPGIHQRTLDALDRNPDFAGWMISADRRTAGIVVQIEDRPGTGEYRRLLVASLRGLAPSVAARGGELHLTGVPVQKIDISQYVERDQRVLLPAAVVILGLALAFLLRRVTAVVVPLAAAGITVIWTMGLYGLTGHATNAITALLPPVLLVVAVAATVHVYSAWLQDGLESASEGELPRSSGDRLGRARRAARAVFLPGLLCAVTTAQGFASLSFGDMAAVRQFGLFAAFGAVAAFVVAVVVVPAVLGLLPSPGRSRRESGAFLRCFLDWTCETATLRPWGVMVVFLMLSIVLAAGIPLLRINTDLIAFLRNDAPLHRDTIWIDDNLTGVLPLDFVIRRKDGAPILDLATYQGLGELEERIRRREHVAGVTSLLAMVRQVERAESGGTELLLPDNPATLVDQLDLLDESGHPLVRRYASPEMDELRITVRLHAVGSSVSVPLVAAIREDAAALLPADTEFTPTGALWMIVRDSDNLVRQQVRSFGAAVALVVIAIGLLLRSMTFTLIAMIPNVVPILWTGGLMGYAGVELSTGTAMIASAVLGLVVDDTIHYLAFYRQVYDGDAAAAIRRTSRAVGQPVTITSIALVLGFWVGALGSFLPTIYFSLLTGLTMISGLICDLLVLPASLVLVDRIRRRNPTGAGGVAAERAA